MSDNPHPTIVKHDTHGLTNEGEVGPACLHILDHDNDELASHRDPVHPDTHLLLGVRPGALPFGFTARLDKVAVVALRDYLDEWLTATQAEAPATTIPNTPED